MPELQLSGETPGKTELITEQKPLTPEEKRILKKISDKKLLFIAGSYVAFLAILVLAWIEKWFDSVGHGEEDTARFKLVAPYVFSFFFILLTVYFVNYYRKSVRPFIIDLKEGFKELLYFPAESYKTPFFNAYYIKTPSKKNAMIRVSKEMYDSIQPGVKGCLCLSPRARFVFSIDVAGKKVEFNEKNSRIYD